MVIKPIPWLLFLNQVANKILCWGNYTQKAFSEQCPDKKVITIEANLRPKVSNKILNNNDKNSYLFVLGGRMHLEESLKLISFAKNLFLGSYDPSTGFDQQFVYS